jgi:hypothetical protein
MNDALEVPRYGNEINEIFGIYAAMIIIITLSATI